MGGVGWVKLVVGGWDRVRLAGCRRDRHERPESPQNTGEVEGQKQKVRKDNNGRERGEDPTHKDNNWTGARTPLSRSSSE